MTQRTYDTRPTITYAGDARDSVGRIMGPGHDGRELLVVQSSEYDEATNRTRVWFRYASREDTGEIYNDPALIAALVDVGTPLWDLPLWLVGAVGYVEIACDGCGATTRQHGITSESKGWALCPDCLSQPWARARIEAKRRENRAAAHAAAAEAGEL
jgi:hypothetical protein